MKEDETQKECEHVWTYLSEGVIMCFECGKATRGGTEDDSHTFTIS